MKQIYKSPTVELWICVEDVLTASIDVQAGYDDTESWKDTWVIG